MTRFEPFRALRYDTARVALGEVISPPYDVIDAGDQAQLEARHRYNAVRLEAGGDGVDLDAYTAARTCLESWIADGVLAVDDEASFTVYRMGYRGGDGRPRQMTGVLGAMALDHEGRGDVLPHETTLASPAQDRLQLLRACRANLSPIWGLSLADGLTAACEPSGPPLARATDDNGVHHRVWRVVAPAAVEAISSTVGRAPVVLADGHHRYQTALAYREEVRREGTPTGAEDLILTFMVEMVDSELDVRAIHRVVSGVAPGVDALGRIEEVLSLEPVETEPADLVGGVMIEKDAMAVITAGQTYLARPRQADAGPGVGGSGVDAEVAGRALSLIGAHTTRYEADLSRVVGAVAGGDADLAVLLRPVGIDALRAVADAGRRFPQKTTYFTPKPATGVVFRTLDGR